MMQLNFQWDIFLSLYSTIVILAHTCNVKCAKFERDAIVNAVLCDSADINLGSAQSVTYCAAQCGLVSTCKSFFYVNDTKQCQGASTVLSSPAGCSSVSSSRYFKSSDFTTTTSTTTTTTTTTATTTTATTTTTADPNVFIPYGTVCSTNADCLLTSTECLQGSCQCTAGYSYDSSTGSCATGCTTYGSTYIEHPGMLLDVPIITEFTASLADCKTYCSNEALCRGFNYCSSCGSLCRLREPTPLTMPHDYYAVPAVDYYSRNCA